jgi:hypothetical protein
VKLGERQTDLFFTGVYLCWGGLSAAWKFFKNFLGLPLGDWDDLQLKIVSPVVTQTTEEAKAGILKRQVLPEYLSWFFSSL